MESRPPAPGARSSRRATVLAIVAISVATSVLAVGFAWRQRNSVSAGIRAYAITTSPASVTIEVDKPAARAYTCRVEVQDETHGAIGVASAIPIPAGQHKVVRTLQIPFQGKAIGVEITDCVRS